MRRSGPPAYPSSASWMDPIASTVARGCGWSDWTTPCQNGTPREITPRPSRSCTSAWRASAPRSPKPTPPTRAAADFWARPARQEPEAEPPAWGPPAVMILSARCGGEVPMERRLVGPIPRAFGWPALIVGAVLNASLGAAAQPVDPSAPQDSHSIAEVQVTASKLDQRTLERVVTQFAKSHG